MPTFTSDHYPGTYVHIGTKYWFSVALGDRLFDIIDLKLEKTYQLECRKIKNNGDCICSGICNLRVFLFYQKEIKLKLKNLFLDNKNTSICQSSFVNNKSI